MTLLENNTLICHAVSCSCAVCNKNDSLQGPFRPFLRYRRRNKDQILAQNAFKKFLSLKPPTLLQDSLHKIKAKEADSGGDGSGGAMGASGASSPESSSRYMGNHSNLAKQQQTSSSALLEVSGSRGKSSRLSRDGRDLDASLREFEESEEKKWALIEQVSTLKFRIIRFERFTGARTYPGSFLHGKEK